MCKRISALLLAFCVLLSLLPSNARAAADPENGRGAFRNSDSEAAFDGTRWYVDAMNGSVLTASRLAEPNLTCTGAGEGELEIWRLTDWAADQVLFWEGRLLVSAGAELRILDPESGGILETRSFAAPVDRFAVSGEGLYVLTGGDVRFFGEGERTLVTGGVRRFWLEDARSLSYMRDEKTIYTLDLSTGAASAAPNLASDLGDVPAASGTRGPGLLTMREKFPHGKYWNHMPNRGCGMAYNNQDGWTDEPCPKHNGYCGTSMQTCNGYAPDGRELSYQCWGYADKLGHDVSGQDPQKNDTAGNGWRKLTSRDSLNNLKAGDIIRYNNHGDSRYAHSIYVTAVSGDAITFTDCNYNGTCVIRWDQTISRSTVYSWFVFLLSAPAEAPTEPTFTLDVNASLDGTPAEDAAGWATFDVWINGEVRATGVSEFCETLMVGTEYEIRGVTPVSGVCFDEEAGESLSGTLDESREVLLILDHYYLNSAGEKVKTTLTDLPKQGKWSYKPICWALETGLASGETATRFAPSKTCTRAQVVTILWVAAGRPQPQGENNPFRDVRRGKYYYKAVLWAVENGITTGLTADRFAPDASCTRGQVVSFLWILAGKPASSAERNGEPSPFRDVRSGEYFYRAVLWAVERGVTSGTSATAFSPKKSCTRAEILGFLYAARDLFGMADAED